MSTIPPARLEWLGEQVRLWQGDGTIDARQAETILGRYAASTRRLPLVRLLTAVGGLFLGVGVIWLVAANIESLSPTVRVAAVAAVWLLAALLIGALVFQAAQTLQVPAYEPLLLACWAVAALVHAYAVEALLPLLVAVSIGTVYVLWASLETAWSGLAFVVSLGGYGLAALAVAALHARWLPTFATAWREVGALLVLVAVTVGAFPPVVAEDWEPGTGTWVLLAAAGLLGATGLVRGTALDRAELGVGAAALAGAAGLVLWEAGADGAADLSGADVTHAVLGITLCAGAAIALAVDGTLRPSGRLTVLATAALVVVTTLQAFTVFAPVLEGAWLFLVLGVVLVGTGLAVDRGRRRLAEAL
ncbi:unannotated protein [freshwater metagenome]|uniref:Unannotated protein n=1 Tax=freshwater metagenome TaxID=449393 RepID=A0A6J6VV24_9ZZZZ|nr:DUF2157 domain-containing protein [Actinomycetota bacterium]